MRFGEKVRAMRVGRGLGLKGLAPQLGVSYTYLSKIECGETVPSKGLVVRLARYFGEDSTYLLLAAGKVPDDVVKILQDNPDEAIRLLRTKFGRHVTARPQ